MADDRADRWEAAAKEKIRERDAALDIVGRLMSALEDIADGDYANAQTKSFARHVLRQERGVS